MACTGTSDIWSEVIKALSPIPESRTGSLIVVVGSAGPAFQGGSYFLGGGGGVVHVGRSILLPHCVSTENAWAHTFRCPGIARKNTIIDGVESDDLDLEIVEAPVGLYTMKERAFTLGSLGSKAGRRGADFQRGNCFLGGLTFWEWVYALPIAQQSGVFQLECNHASKQIFLRVGSWKPASPMVSVDRSQPTLQLYCGRKQLVFGLYLPSILTESKKKCCQV